MNYWCKTCNCHKGASGADECAVDGHIIMRAKEREIKVQTAHEARVEIIMKLGYQPPSILSAEWIAAKVQEERNIFQAEIAALKAKLPEEKPKEQLKAAKPKGEWTPKVGDRVWVSGKTWSMEGTITGWAKDDASVPWIKTDDGRDWDARDLGSVRRLEDK